MKRRLRWLLLPLTAYCALVTLVAVMQRSLMYHPPHLTPEEMRPVVERNRLKPWTNALGLRIGWHRSAVGGTNDYTVLVLHGNAGSAAGRGYILDPIEAGMNAEIFVLEYPGFADRPGTPTKDSILDAAQEAFGLLTNRAPILLVGESLGTGVACFLAAKHSAQVAGVVLLVPYDNTVNAAAERFPWLPAGLLLRDRFVSDEWLPHYRGPVVFAVAEKDEILPPQLGKRLFELYPGPKQLTFCAGAGHMAGANRPKEFWQEADHFIRATHVSQ